MMQQKEQKDPVYQLFYEDVGKFQLRLSAEEQTQLTRRLAEVRQNVIEDILEIQDAREKLFKMLKERMEKSHSFSRLISFEKKQKNEVIEKVENFLSSQGEEQKEKLRSLNIKDKVFLDIILPAVKDQLQEQTQACLREMAEIEETLIRSVLMAARSIARKYGSGVHGIELKDAIQEANRGMLHAVHSYNPEFRTASGRTAKFSTYAYNIAEQFVRSFVMASSRIVRIPRVGLDKMFLVVRAMEKTGSGAPLEKIQEAANRISALQKGRPLKAREILSVQDVEEAITHLDGFCVSLDWRGGQGEKNLEDILPKGGEQDDDLVGRKLAREKLVKAVKDTCSEHEVAVLFGRYPIQDESQGVITYEEIQKMLKAEWNLDLSLDKVMRLEDQAVQKLRGVKMFRNWLKQGVFTHEE